MDTTHTRDNDPPTAVDSVTDRKRAAEEAQLLAEQLTTTLESLTDGFFTLDRNWRFTYVNREAERMFSLPRAELLGHDIWEKFPEARDTISHQEYERALRDNVAVQFETVLPAAERLVRCAGVPLDAGSGGALPRHHRGATDRRGPARERGTLPALAKATIDAIGTGLATNAGGGTRASRPCSAIVARLDPHP